MDDINLLNLANFNYIINCSIKYNNVISHQHYYNLNISSITANNIMLLDQIYTWCQKNSNSKIIILDDITLINAMTICMYFIMNNSKISFEKTYNALNKYTKLLCKNNYKILNEISTYLDNRMEID
jgi:hypothetical protein